MFEVLFLQQVIQLWCTEQHTLMARSADPTIHQNNGEVRGQNYDKIPAVTGIAIKNYIGKYSQFFMNPVPHMLWLKLDT